MLSASVVALLLIGMLSQAPIVRPLAKRFNARVLAMAGGLILGLSFIASPYSPNQYIFGLCMATAGLGMSFTYFTMVLSMKEFFGEAFYFWCVIASFGSIGGAFLLPFLIERSLENYGLHGAFLIMGAISLHTLPFGAALRSRASFEGRHARRSSNHDAEDCRTPRKATRKATRKGGARRNGLKRKQGQDESMKLLEAGKNHGGDKAKRKTTPEINRKMDSKTHEDLLQVLASEEILTESEGHEARSDLTESRESVWLLGVDTKAPEDMGNIQATHESSPYQGSFLIRFLKSLVVIKEPMFALSCPGIFLGNYVLYAWFLFLVPHAEWLGIPSSRAVFLSTMAGVSGILGRFIALTLEHLKANVFVVYMWIFTISAVIFFIDPLSSTYWFLSVTACLQAVALFASDALTIALPAKAIANDENFPAAASVSFVLTGLGIQLGGAMSGLVYDVSGSYTVLFFVLGGLSLCFTLNMLILLITSWRRDAGQIH